MFNFFKKKPKGDLVTLKLDGLHCTSCSLNIDGELEETKGVLSSNTSYAKSETMVEFDPKLVDLKKIKSTIESLGYKVKR